MCRLKTIFESELIITTSEFFGKLNFNRIKLDAPNFEREFNVYSDEKIKTLQILTADVMQILYEIKEKIKFEFDVVIRSNKMYFRIHTGNIFEATLVKRSMDIDNLRMCYNVLVSIKELTELLCKELEKSELM